VRWRRRGVGEASEQRFGLVILLGAFGRHTGQKVLRLPFARSVLGRRFLTMPIGEVVGRCLRKSVA
jgi:hypothetical protein